MVRRNLYDYLEQAQEDCQYEWIFIDAICINQHDLDEKMLLVANMQAIFRQANEVLAWLGCDQTMSPDRIDELQHVCDQEVTALTPTHGRETEDDDPLLLMIAKCDYWQRLWIIQEVVFAKTLTIHYGPLHIDAEALAIRFTNNINGKGDSEDISTISLFKLMRMLSNSGSRRLDRGISMCWILLQLRIPMRRHYRAVNLSHVITAFADQRCIIPYDLLFGTLAITGSHIEPDYGMPRIELYLRGLIEGLLEDDSLCDDEHDRWRHVEQFCVTLMQKLGLRSDDPVTGIVTLEAMRLCQHPLTIMNREDITATFGPCEPRSEDTTHHCAPCALWHIHSQSTEALLKRLKNTQTLILDPGKVLSKTFNDWTAWVEDIYVGVREKMHRTSVGDHFQSSMK